MSAVDSGLVLRVSELVRHGCRMDVLAYKPGNVSVASAGHGMSAEDFFRSADCVAGVIAEPGLTVGERVLRSIEATQAAVGCNTNLGIVLLLAPLVHAVLHHCQDEPREPSLRQALHGVLSRLDRRDASFVFEAIRCAKPAGLGRRSEHDVAATPQVGLREIMATVAGEDRIARQYVTDFEDLYTVGLGCLKEAFAFWSAGPDTEQWAMVACYLGFLGRFPDTHIVRKFGMEAAQDVTRSAKRLETKLKACENPIDAVLAVQAFDEKLKREGLNPGTSADLAVVSLVLFHLEDLYANIHSSRAASSPEAA